MNAEVVERLWRLFGLGSARSEGWGYTDTSPVPGSGYIFAYGIGNHTAGVIISNAEGEERTLEPATKQNVLQTLIEMGITETQWSL
jgi:hypothetical protein